TPRHSRERVTARFLNKVFDGALDQFVLSVLRAKDASADELKDLEKLIAKARRDKQNRGQEGDCHELAHPRPDLAGPRRGGRPAGPLRRHAGGAVLPAAGPARAADRTHPAGVPGGALAVPAARAAPLVRRLAECRSTRPRYL